MSDKNIPGEILLNLILVNENIRPSMLVQPKDYREKTEKDPKTKAILNKIKSLFPNLKHSSDYETYQGIIISHNDYNGKEISLEKMGEILGYPCYKDFSNIDRNETIYGVDIFVRANDYDSYQLFANICKDKQKIMNLRNWLTRHQ